MRESIYKRITNLKTGLVTYCSIKEKYNTTIEWE